MPGFGECDGRRGGCGDLAYSLSSQPCTLLPLPSVSKVQRRDISWLRGLGRGSGDLITHFNTFGRRSCFQSHPEHALLHSVRLPSVSQRAQHCLWHTHAPHPSPNPLSVRSIQFAQVNHNQIPRHLSSAILPSSGCAFYIPLLSSGWAVGREQMYTQLPSCRV